MPDPVLRDPQDPSRRPDPGEVLDRDTRRWVGISAVALLAGAVGVLLGRPALVLAGAVGVGFAGYARIGGAPALDLHVERELSREHAGPGERVRVDVTVRNEGEGLLGDLRVVDGVPPGLAVVEGSPRVGTALRPGKAVGFSYVVEAGRGHHEFEPLTVVARSLSGASEREYRLPGPDSAVTCTPRLAVGDPLPLRPQTTQYTGRVTTDAGGPGVEFHGVRQYRPGDPLTRVDWGRVARTGELSTVEFRQERAATVVLLVDTREDAYLAPDEDALSAVERSVTAAGAAFTSLLATGDRVGIAAYGPGSCWLAPNTGDSHRAEARALLGADEAFAPTPSDEPFFASIQLRRLRRRLPSDAQLVVFTPCCDDYVASVVRRLDAYGHLVTVVSPDPTTDETVGQQLARTERSLRLSRLRRAGIRVVDWGPDERLAAAVARADRRWSA